MPRHRGHRSRLLEASSATIDALEPRRLLAAVINGTNGDDTILISVGADDSLSVTINGAPGGVAAPGDGVVEVNGLDGNDSITLLNTGMNTLFLAGGPGSDSYFVGNGNLKGDILRNVQLIDPAGQGDDTVVVNDTFGGGTSYLTDSDSVTIVSLSLPFIALPPMIDPGDATTILGSNGDDTLDLNGVPGDSFPAKTVFDLGPNDDVVRLGGSQNMVDPGLPASSRILASGGSDRIIVNDQNPTSPRTDLRFDENGFVGGLTFAGFQNLDISAHQLPGGAAQPVTFRGFVAPAPNILITGTAGLDHVQFGELAHPITGQNYWGTVSLELAAGNDLVDINLLNAPSSSWTFYDIGLGIGSGPASFFASGVVDLVMNTTNGPDVFTVQDTPNLWNITLNARNGDDLLRMGTQLDLDDAFDNSLFKFVGGFGGDSVVLDDTQDQLGDLDEYHITDGLITKNDFGSGSSSFDLQIQQAEDLTLQMDHDTNRLFYDLNQYNDAEIFGNNGNDQFFNRDSVSTTTDVLATTLCERVIFHGGVGLDELLLNDFARTGNGAQHVFDLNTYAYRSTPGVAAQTVTFDSFTLLDLTGSNTGGDEITISVKPLVADLAVVSGGGNDTFIVGGGDLDDSGLMTTGGVTLSAGTGNDNITFDDRLDVDEAGETETYTLGNLTIAKGAAQLVYSTFESQTLLVADRVLSGQFNTVPVVNVNAVSGFLNSTTIIGGLNRGSMVNVGNGNLTNIAGTLNLHDCTSVALLDAAVSTARTYTLAAGGMTAPRPINYLNCGTVTLQASQSNDTINVRGTPPGTTLHVNANAGADAVFVGFGNISADLQGAVNVNGGTGDNAIRFDNAADPSPAIQSMTGSTFTDGLVHGYTGFATVTVVEGPGGTNLSVISTSTRTVINGGNGDDLFTVGGGDVDANLRSTPGQALLIDGVAGNDSIVINDLNDTNIDSYFFERFGGQDRFRKQDAGIDYFIDWLNIDGVILEASNAPTPGGPLSGIVVVETATPLRINGNAGNDWVQVLDASAPVTVNTGLGDRDLLHVNDSDGVPVTVVVDQSDDVEGLLIRGGGTLRVTAAAVLTKTRLATFPEALTIIGVLDLAGGALLSRAGGPTPAAFRNQIVSGRNGGAWNGTAAGGAINSSTAAGSVLGDGVGYGLGSEIGLASIGGFAINPGDTLVRYALDGDADLNGSVSIADFSRVAANFNGTSKVWTTGDSNYDNATNIADFSPLAANFNQAATASRSPAPTFGTRRIDRGIESKLRLLLDDGR